MENSSLPSHASSLEPMNILFLCLFVESMEVLPPQCFFLHHNRPEELTNGSCCPTTAHRIVTALTNPQSPRHSAKSENEKSPTFAQY